MSERGISCGAVRCADPPNLKGREYIYIQEGLCQVNTVFLIVLTVEKLCTSWCAKQTRGGVVLNPKT